MFTVVSEHRHLNLLPVFVSASIGTYKEGRSQFVLPHEGAHKRIAQKKGRHSEWSKGPSNVAQGPCGVRTHDLRLTRSALLPLS